ncbi:hypothetical protein PoB_005085200, partial [Plakobranchus ocellatus]
MLSNEPKPSGLQMSEDFCFKSEWIGLVSNPLSQLVSHPTFPVYNQSNCGTKVTSILTLMVNLDLHNKRLACLSYNRTDIGGFDITDISELFIVLVPKNEKGNDLQFAVKALVWIAAALIVFVLAQQITNFTSSRTGEEGDSDRQRMETLMRNRILSHIKVRKTLPRKCQNSGILKGKCHGISRGPFFVRVQDRA